MRRILRVGNRGEDQRKERRKEEMGCVGDLMERENASEENNFQRGYKISSFSGKGKEKQEKKKEKENERTKRKNNKQRKEERIGGKEKKKKKKEEEKEKEEKEEAEKKVSR